MAFQYLSFHQFRCLLTTLATAVQATCLMCQSHFHGRRSRRLQLIAAVVVVEFLVGFPSELYPFGLYACPLVLAFVALDSPDDGAFPAR